MSEFTKAFYVNFGCPDNEYTLKVLECYLQCGVKTFLFDIPSADPYLEKDRIKKNMKYVLEHQGIRGVMDGVSDFRQLHGDADIFLIVYSDSVTEVGTEAFMDWCGENRIGHIGLISREKNDEMISCMVQKGIFPNVSAEYSLADAVKSGLCGGELITIQLGEKDTALRKSFGERLGAVRSLARENPIFAEMGISTAEDVREVKEAGADGVIIGSAAMDLWDDTAALQDYLRTICEV